MALQIEQIAPDRSSISPARRSPPFTRTAQPPAIQHGVQTDDIDAQLQKAVALGATVIMPVTTIPGAVTFAVFADPQGNRIGLAASQTP